MVQAQSLRIWRKKEKEKNVGPVNYQNKTNDTELQSLPHSGNVRSNRTKEIRGKTRCDKVKHKCLDRSPQ